MKNLLGKISNGLGAILSRSSSQGSTNHPMVAERKRMIASYEIGRKLGDGAMGAVYLSKEPDTGREVAIKTMVLTGTFDSEQLIDIKSRFFREAEIVERLSHPNIVKVFDMGEDDKVAYISMELLMGYDLERHTKPDNLLPYPKALDIIACVADALGYAHERDIVHRDVKPGNIMYDPASGAIKVLDFGISRITTDEDRTKLGVVLGSPNYMSPEQLRGYKIGGPSDIFSLGITLYQILVGKLPFEGKTAMEVMTCIAKHPHVDVLTLRPELPPCAGAIIDRALSKEIEDRFQSGKEMADAIRQCLAFK
ncbi:MAG: serine/threonine-protein kinase [Gallionellaceae bacterium]